MKKIIPVVLFAFLLIASVGCTKGSQEEKVETRISGDEATEETKSAVTETDKQEEVTAQTEEKDSENKDEDTANDEKSNTDSNTFDKFRELTGSALYLAVVSQDPPKKIKAEYLYTNPDGTTTQSTSYIENGMTRMETVGEAGSDVMIFDEKEGITYSYNTETKLGTKMLDASEDMMEMDEDELESDEENNIKTAEIMDYNGRPTLHVVMDFSEEGYAYTVEQWIDIMYTITVKSETKLDGVVNSSMEAISFSDDFDSAPDLFIPPADITFIEYDMESMFDYMDSIDTTDN